MFFKKIKQKLKDLQRKVDNLEVRTRQLECPHVYLLTKYAYGGESGCKWLEYECACGQTKHRRWRDLSKREQQATKILKTVPADWSVKTKGGK